MKTLELRQELLPNGSSSGPFRAQSGPGESCAFTLCRGCFAALPMVVVAGTELVSQVHAEGEDAAGAGAGGVCKVFRVHLEPAISH